MDPRRLYNGENFNDRAPLAQHAAPTSISDRHSSSSSSQRIYTRPHSPHVYADCVLSEEELRDLLLDMLIKVHEGHWKDFIPRSDIKAIVKAPIIARAIRRGLGKQSSLSDEVEKCAKAVEKKARSLFAVLLWMNRSGEIHNFCENGLWDSDLPLTLHTVNKRSVFRTQDGAIIEAFKGWNEFSLKEFDRFQWSVTAPVLSYQPKGQPCLKFHDKTVLPFIPLNHGGSTKDPSSYNKQGGYSEVHAFGIHHAHHNFWSIRTQAVGNSSGLSELPIDLLIACRTATV